MRQKAIGLALALLLASALFGSVLTRADTSGALVLATCGSLPLAYAVGTTRSMTLNVNGQVCQ